MARGPSHKYTTATFDMLINSLGRNIKRVGTYTGLYKSVEFVCLSCGTNWHPLPSNIIKRGSGCPKCSAVKRGELISKMDRTRTEITHAQIRKSLSDINCTAKLPDVTWSSTLIELHCNQCASITKVKAGNLAGGKSRCATCWHKSRALKQRTSHAEFVTKFPCYKFLSAYKGLRYDVTTECVVCKNIRTSKADSLPHGCSNCKLRKFPTINDFKSALTRTNPTLRLLSQNWEQYKYADFKCTECDTKFQAVSHYILKGYGCPKCTAKTSRPQKAIETFLTKLGVEFETCNRDILYRKELDIYVPNSELAIEINGIFWHDEEKKGQHYHLEKMQECVDSGVRLLQFWDTEIISRPVAVKSLVLANLGLHKYVVYARELALKEVVTDEAVEFLEKNHIQGSTGAKVKLGLYDAHRLVAIMTFSKPRLDKKYEWELIRYAVLAGYHIPGAASRLLTAFERQYQPSSLLSYADLRYSAGRVYRKLGFALDHISPPGYAYAKQTKLISRYQAQKHRLHKILPNFRPELSEQENMMAAGFRRVWDCGQLVLTKLY